jgi:hypothetical protein
MMLNLQCSECYKSQADGPTYTYCIKRNNLMELVATFPDANKLFMNRAIKRRVEFRRIKK